MTLALAATLPWGRMAPYFESLNAMSSGSVQRGVVLAADSRWSKLIGGKYVPFKDVGAKLVQISHDAGIVYSGDVSVAEACIKELTRQLPLRSTKTQNFNNPRWTGRLFSKIYSAEKKTRPDLSYLGFVVATCSSSGVPVIYRLESSKDFLPTIPRTSITAIGSTVALDRLAEEVKKEDAPRDHGSISLDPTEWALRLVGLFYAGIVKPGIDPTVGGHISAAIVRNGRFEDLNILGTPMRKSLDMEWQRITPVKNELEFHTGDDRKNYFASGDLRSKDI